MSPTNATGTTILPDDDTIPQITEGDEFMTLAITPTSATNKLKIEVVMALSQSANSFVTTALFQDSTASALAAMYENPGAASLSMSMSFTHFMTAGTTSETTFRVRAGMDRTGTTTFNGNIGSRIFGGAMASSITITEISV